MSAMDLTIAVLNFRGEALLPDCLQSIWAQEIPCSWELLIVDDASPIPPQVLLPHRLIRHQVNSGSNIKGCNTAFREAKGDWVLLMANDVRLHPSCFLNLWNFQRVYDVFQPMLLQPDGTVDNLGLQWVWPGYGRRVRAFGLSREIDAFANTCVLMRKRTWEAVGGFTEALGISHEDIDFSLKAKRLGFTIGCCPLAQATHLMGATLARNHRNLSPYYRRARRLVIQRNYRGLDRLTRLWATGLLDGLASQVERRRQH